ncbi:MAG: protein phosphatase 2C domain-containing protein [Anaerolineales bacterium]
MTKYFNKLFGKLVKKTNSIDKDDSLPTEPRKYRHINESKSIENIVKEYPEQKDISSIQLTQFIAGSSQSVGIQRDHNEDALFSLTTTLASNSSNLPFGLYIVADGMGGHQHGEIASSIAIRAIAEHILNKLFIPLVSLSPQPLKDSIQEILINGVKIAHETIQKKVTGGGTTLTTAIILSDQIVIAHVGDCRVYTVDPEGHMKVLTRDHSLVNRLVELGQLTPGEAEVHPQRNVLYRALGQGDLPEPDIITEPRPKPGHLLICSDGLWGVVNEDTLSQIIMTHESPYEACQEMIVKANEAGGPDNITTILVRLPSESKKLE